MIFSASGLQADLNWNTKERAQSLYSQDYLSQNNHAIALENRIRTGTGVYSVLLYIEIVLCIVISAVYGVLRVSVAQLVITGIALVCMVSACIMLAIAKTKLSSSLQRAGLVTVAIGTVFSILCSVMYLIAQADNLKGLDDELYEDLMNDDGKKAIVVVSILFVFVQFAMGLAVTLSARVVTKLMTERETILEDLSVKRSASVVAVL